MIFVVSFDPAYHGWRLAVLHSISHFVCISTYQRQLFSCFQNIKFWHISQTFITQLALYFQQKISQLFASDKIAMNIHIDYIYSKSNHANEYKFNHFMYLQKIRIYLCKAYINISNFSTCLLHGRHCDIGWLWVSRARFWSLYFFLNDCKINYEWELHHLNMYSQR